MGFRSRVGETRVKNLNANYHPLKDILLVMRISRWLGLLPVQISITKKGQDLALRFVGCRLPLLISLTTFAIQLMLSVLLAYQLLECPIDVTRKAILMLDWFFFFVTAIVVPRITLRSLGSLKLALDRIVTAHDLLTDTKFQTKTSCVPFALVSFFTITTIISSCFREASRVGTDLLFYEKYAWLAFIAYPIPKTYCIFATWLVPLQLFTLCRSLVHCLDSLGEDIQRHLTSTARTRECIPLPTHLERLQRVLVNLTDAIAATEAYFRFPMLLYGASRLVILVRHAHLLFSHLVELSLCWQKHYGEFLSLLWIGANDLANFWLVIHAADLLQAAAEENKQRIKRYVYNDLTTQEGLQLHWFREQVLGVQAQITGGGMFVIGKKMIPPLLGVIATYFFVTIQLSPGSSE